MTKILLIVAGLFAANAFGAIIVPSKDKPVCLKRVYSKKHMQQNPKQLLNELYVKVAYTTDREENIILGSVVGMRKGAAYGNTAYCGEVRADGSVRCSIDCDGGAFTLANGAAPESVFLNIGDYYFPLFKNRMSAPEPEDPEEYEQINLDGKANQLWRLEAADPAQCDAAIQRIEPGQEGGGC